MWKYIISISVVALLASVSCSTGNQNSALEPNDAYAYIKRGLIKAELGDKREADKDYQKALGPGFKFPDK